MLLAMVVRLAPQVRRAARCVGIRSAGTRWWPRRNGSTGSHKEVTQNQDAVRAIELSVVVGIGGLPAGEVASSVEEKVWPGWRGFACLFPVPLRQVTLRQSLLGQQRS